MSDRRLACAPLAMLLAISAPALGQPQGGPPQGGHQQGGQPHGSGPSGGSPQGPSGQPQGSQAPRSQPGEDRRQPADTQRSQAQPPAMDVNRAQQTERRRDNPDVRVYRGQDAYRTGSRPSLEQRHHEAMRDRGTYRHAYRASQRYRVRPYARPHGWYDRDWVLGDILPALFWTRVYWIVDYWRYDLPIPPDGCVWVRYGNDALLIDERTGEIIQIIYDVFY